MKDEHRQQLLDQYEEAALMLLMDEYAEADGARLWKEFEEAEKNGEIPEIPAELDARCRQLIQTSYTKQRRTTHIRKNARILGKVAVSVLVFLGLATTTVLSVDALRVPVLNFFLQQSEKFSSISFHEPNAYEEIQVDVLNRLDEIPLPDGYSLIQKQVCEDGTIIFNYANNHGHVITFDITPSVGHMNVDTEAAEKTDIEINEHKAIFIKKEGYRVIWFDTEHDLTYTLYASNLDSDVFWKLVYRIAE